MAGKADWLAHGLPTQGDDADLPRAKDVLRRDAVTARPDEPVGAVATRVAGSPYGFALVTAKDGTVLGRLSAQALDGDRSERAEQVMDGGPSTIRPDRPLAELAEQLDRRGLRTAVVTDPEGRLLGVATLADVRARLTNQHRHP